MVLKKDENQRRVLPKTVHQAVCSDNTIYAGKLYLQAVREKNNFHGFRHSRQKLN
jgi:hypothetical protein